MSDAAKSVRVPLIGFATIVFTTLLIVAIPAFGMRSPDFKWKKRPLLIFASDHRDPDLLQTRCAIQRRSFDLEQRDIIVGNFLAKGLSSLDGQDISALVASNFRQLFDIDNARFALLLIGKDGGEKLRSGESPDLDTIFSLIDGMPV